MQQRIDTAPRLGGRILTVTTDAHNEIGEDWTQFRDGAAILALFSLLVLGLLHLAMARVSASLAQADRRVSRRWAAATMPPMSRCGDPAKSRPWRKPSTA